MKKIFIAATFALLLCLFSGHTIKTGNSNSSAGLSLTESSSISLAENETSLVPELEPSLEESSSLSSEIKASNAKIYDFLPISLERDYEWYIDQSDTGEYYFENCGPTCAVMAAKWHNKDFAFTVEDARAAISPTGGGWYILNVFDYLEKNKVPVRFENFTDGSDNVAEKLVENLQNGNIIITLFDTDLITTNTDVNAETGKYFIDAAMHYTIILGAKLIDGNLYFEVYDPNSGRILTDEGKPVHKGRFYLAEELINASIFDEKYSQYIIVG